MHLDPSPVHLSGATCMVVVFKVFPVLYHFCECKSMVQPGNEVTNLVMVVKSIAKVEILL